MRGNLPENDLAYLLDARSVAVIGASDREGSAGWRLMKYLDEFGFQGEVSAVNPRLEEWGRFHCYADISEVPGRVDHAVVVVPQHRVDSTLEACVQSGVRAVSVFASGYAEVGDVGREHQRRLENIIHGSQTRLLGPNCLGIVNRPAGLVVAATSAFTSLPPRSGPVSVVTQSGALGVYLVSLLGERDIGLRYFVSTGNEADIALGESLDYVVRDSHTEVAFCYVEGLRDPDRFLAAAEEANRRRIRVVALKAGRTRVAADAVASHTAALAGDDIVYRTILERAGITICDSIEESVEAVAAACAPSHPGEFRRAAVLTVSGGMGAVTADALASSGFDLPRIDDETQAYMRRALPYSSATNPIDATGQVSAEPEFFATFMDLLDRSHDYDVIVVVLAYVAAVPSVYRRLEPVLLDHAERGKATIAVIGMVPEDSRRRLRDRGIVVGAYPSRVAHELAMRRRIARRAAHRISLEGRSGPVSNAVALDEFAAMDRLESAGLPFARWLEVGPDDSPERLVDRMGLPLVLKRIEPGVVHKTERGSVLLGLNTVAEVGDAISRLRSSGRPESRIMAQQMIELPHELIVGFRRDPVFGIVMVLGAGGLDTEAFADRVVLVPPVTADDVVQALHRLDAWPLLAGSRGREAADVDAVTDFVLGLYGFALSDLSVLEAETNPVLVGRSAAVAVDAVLRVTSLDP